jgi:hypothetical protein
VVSEIIGFLVTELAAASNDAVFHFFSSIIPDFRPASNHCSKLLKSRPNLSSLRSMPGVAILPPSPAFGGFGSSTYHSVSLALTFCRHECLADHFDFLLVEMQNGPAPTPRDTVSDIKAAAKEQVQKARGASATSLLRTARDQILLAKAKDGEGDLKGALSALTKAASLAAMFMDTPEFKHEMGSGKKGVLTLDFLTFQQVSILRGMVKSFTQADT